MSIKRKISTLGVRSLVILFLLICLCVTLFPVVWMLLTSLKTMPETYLWPPTFLPHKPTLEAYLNIWNYQNFSRMLLNSLIVAVPSTICSSVLASLAAYGFSRFNFKGKNPLLFLFLFTQMVPAILLLLPYFVVMRKLGLVNTYTALIIAFTSFSLPFCTWLLKSFFDAIPLDLDDAAMIDGCNRIQALTLVVFPLALPGIAATTLFGFLVAWNHYLFAMGLVTSPDMYTLPVGIASLVGEFRVAWNELMAGAMIASGPALFLFLLLRKWFVAGLTAGAVKG